jgi:enamine deaminase RidA (YjgF/YER057c/UK114 family)
LLAPGDIVEQIKITIQNLEKVLKKAGISLEKFKN